MIPTSALPDWTNCAALRNVFAHHQFLADGAVDALRPQRGHRRPSVWRVVGIGD
jgi:hypothetical protein